MVVGPEAKDRRFSLAIRKFWKSSRLAQVIPNQSEFSPSVIDCDHLVPSGSEIHIHSGCTVHTNI